MKLLWVKLLFLFTICFYTSEASLIPFQGKLNPAFNTQFTKIEAAYKTDSKAANLLAGQLYQNTNNASDDIRAWALLTYSYLLLDNDSISKATKLLNDSSLTNWASLPNWLKAYHALNKSVVLTFKGDYTKAEIQLENTLSNYSKDVEGALRLHLLQAYADNYRYQGRLELSLNKWYEALKMSENLGDSSDIITCYTGRGTVRFLQRELEKAESDINIMFNYYERTGNLQLRAYGYTLKGLLKYQANEPEKAIEYNLESYRIRKSINDLKGQGESLNNLALAYMGQKNWAQALRYLNEAIQLKTAANDLTQMTVIFNNTGYCERKLGNLEQASKYFEMALNRGLENGQMGDVIRTYRYMTQVFVDQQNFKKAFNAQSRLTHLKDSLAKAEKNEVISDMEMKYENDKNEHEIRLLQQEKTITTNRWLTLAMSLFLIIIIGILFIDNQKRKHRQETKLLVAEDGLQKAELKRLSEKAEYDQNKLSQYTENLLNKTELVTQLEQRLNKLAKASDKTSYESRKSMKDFSSIRILTDDDWTEFKNLFEGVHSGFLQKLLELHGNLTDGEQRLFLLMKLNLSTKEIANILGVSPDSVKKGRYRLKKKIGLPDVTPLQDFVTSFDT